MPPRVALLVYDGVEELEAFLVIDYLRRTGISVETIKCFCREFIVNGLHNIAFRADKCFEGDLSANTLYDACIVVGGRQDRLKECQDSLDFIKNHANNNKILGVCCTALRTTAELGIFENRKIVDHPSVPETLNKTSGPVIRDGNIITSLGLSSTSEFALTLIELMQGPECRQNLMNELSYL
ncbi:hypothetical protein GEMRC1_010894 [Eukaryota sp. GEM-RC1]